jgi:hypothetical protein
MTAVSAAAAPLASESAAQPLHAVEDGGQEHAQSRTGFDKQARPRDTRIDDMAAILSEVMMAGAQCKPKLPDVYDADDEPGGQAA